MGRDHIDKCPKNGVKESHRIQKLAFGPIELKYGNLEAYCNVPSGMTLFALAASDYAASFSGDADASEASENVLHV